VLLATDAPAEVAVDAPSWGDLTRRAIRLSRALDASVRGRPADAAVIVKGGRGILDSYPPRG
jgi:hypothetical protein